MLSAVGAVYVAWVWTATLNRERIVYLFKRLGLMAAGWGWRRYVCTSAVLSSAWGVGRRLMTKCPKHDSGDTDPEVSELTEQEEPPPQDQAFSRPEEGFPSPPRRPGARSSSLDLPVPTAAAIDPAHMLVPVPGREAAGR